MKLVLKTLELDLLHEVLNRTPETDIKKLKIMSYAMHIMKPIVEDRHDKAEIIKEQYKTEDYQVKVKNKETGEEEVEARKKIPTDKIDEANEAIASMEFIVEFSDAPTATYVKNKVQNFPSIYKNLDGTIGLKWQDDIMTYTSLIEKLEAK